MVFGGDNECQFYREHNISLLPVIPINGSHVADNKVTPPEDGAITASQGDTSYTRP